jgi:hypothetical protein
MKCAYHFQPRSETFQCLELAYEVIFGQPPARIQSEVNMRDKTSPEVPSVIPSTHTSRRNTVTTAGSRLNSVLPYRVYTFLTCQHKYPSSHVSTSIRVFKDLRKGSET